MFPVEAGEQAHPVDTEARSQVDVKSCPAAHLLIVIRVPHGRRIAVDHVGQSGPDSERRPELSRKELPFDFREHPAAARLKRGYDVLAWLHVPEPDRIGGNGNARCSAGN